MGLSDLVREAIEKIAGAVEDLADCFRCDEDRELFSKKVFDD